MSVSDDDAFATLNGMLERAEWQRDQYRRERDEARNLHGHELDRRKRAETEVLRLRSEAERLRGRIKARRLACMRSNHAAVIPMGLPGDRCPECEADTAALAQAGGGHGSE